MALRYFDTDIIGAGVAITAASNDTIIITEGTDIVSTGNDAISSASAISNASIQVDGTVASAYTGISMSGWTGSNTVVVGRTGRVIGDTGFAIATDGADAAVYNSGEIASYASGTSTIIFGSDRAYLFNEGTIFAAQGNSAAVSYTGTLSNSINTLINTGSIISTSGQDTGAANSAFRGDDGAIDQVFNSGLISGDVLLVGGNDLFDGAGGRVIGRVLGGDGDDLLRGGGNDDHLDEMRRQKR